jgi:hypothetical protein
MSSSQTATPSSDSSLSESDIGPLPIESTGVQERRSSACAPDSDDRSSGHTRCVAALIEALTSSPRGTTT